MSGRVVRAGEELLRGLGRAASGAWGFLRYFGSRMYRRWDDDKVFFSAAALSFNVLITILPLGLLIITLSGMAFSEHSELRAGLGNWLENVSPVLPHHARAEIESAIFHGSTGIPGMIGFVFLLWLVSRLFGSIRTAFDRIFEVESGRSVLGGKLFDFLLAILVAVCFIAAVILSAMAGVVADSPVGEVLSEWPLVGRLIGAGAAGGLALLFTVLLFLMLYKAAPNRRVGWGQALLATALATLLTALGARLYGAVISAPGWGVVYGSMARVMATFFLLYWECVLLLGAAEASQVVHEYRKSASGGEGQSDPAGSGREGDAGG